MARRRADNRLARIKALLERNGCHTREDVRALVDLENRQARLTSRPKDESGGESGSAPGNKAAAVAAAKAKAAAAAAATAVAGEGEGAPGEESDKKSEEEHEEQDLVSLPSIYATLKALGVEDADPDLGKPEGPHGSMAFCLEHHHGKVAPLSNHDNVLAWNNRWEDVGHWL